MLDPRINEYLPRIGIEELEPAGRYRCKRCQREWRYKDEPYWWKCPDADCAVWMDDAGPGVWSMMRVLGALRPSPPPGQLRARRNVGGRPPRPKVPPDIVTEAFRRLSTVYGHYPPDKDLADELEVSKSTIRNYRSSGYLPPRK